MKTRPGYYTEQNRNEVFRQIIADENFRSEQHRKILFALVAAKDGLTMHEITERTGIPVHTVSARLSIYELRSDDMNWVVVKEDPGGKEVSKSKTGKCITRTNPESGMPNTVFFINEQKFKTKKQLELGFN